MVFEKAGKDTVSVVMYVLPFVPVEELGSQQTAVRAN